MGETAAAIYSLIETAKLNGLDLEAYLANILTRISLITKSTASQIICRATDAAPNHKQIKPRSRLDACQVPKARRFEWDLRSGLYHGQQAPACTIKPDIWRQGAQMVCSQVPSADVSCCSGCATAR